MSEKVFITTAIHYTNGKPHIGHAFEFLVTDVISRWNEINGKEVVFLTGTDEHGQKIEKKANALHISPKELCDQNSELFKDLCQKLDIGYTRFIRTTDPDHAKKVYEFYEKCKNDIYMGEYNGWYNIREESFVTQLEAKLNNYKDPVTGDELTRFKEPSYFFKLSKYADRVKQHIIDNPDFIVPSSYREVIIKRIERLEDNDIQDLSISRSTTNTQWGIPVPGDPDHVLYVWFDALINYITGSPNGEQPADIHVIGKDILWFHTTIWLSMLMSANLEFPKQIFVHGFVCDENGQKMSKSVGNVVDPVDLVKKYPVDAIRYYLIQDFNRENDFRFSESTLVRHHDSNLLANLGNFVNRVFGLFHKYSNGIVPNRQYAIKDGKYLFDVNDTVKQLGEYIKQFELGLYADKVFELLTQCNTYVNDTCIWEIGNEKYNDSRTEQTRQGIILTLLESVHIIAHLLYPIIPSTSEKMLGFLNRPRKRLSELEWGMLPKIPKCQTKLFQVLNQEASQQRMKKNMNKRDKRKEKESIN